MALNTASDHDDRGPGQPGSSGVLYPVSDHMGESGLQKWVCDLLIGLLRSYLAQQEEHPMLVGGNQFFYLREGDAELRLCPDVFVIEDETIPITEVRSWKLWEHEGKGPALAIEVVSGEYEKDYDPAQLARYEQLGVRELVRYDPEFYLHPRATKFGPRRRLTHWVRNEAGRLIERPLTHKHALKSALFDCWFVHEAPRALRLGVGPEGRRLWPTDAEARQAAEVAQRAEAEARRAAEAAQQAEAEARQAEAARADKAEAEVERLRAELARLRG